MAQKDIPITNDLNLEGNSLKNAKVIIPVDGDDISSKDYVDGEVTLDSSDAPRDTDIEVGALAVGTTIDGLTVKEILSLMTLTVIPPDYVIPTITLEAIDNGTTSPVPLKVEVGEQIDVDLTASFTANDSDGLDIPDPYTFSGDSIAIPAAQAGAVFQFAPYTFKEGANQWTVDVDYLGASEKNDNTGTGNSTGIFLDGTSSESTEVNAYWPYYATVEPTSSIPDILDSDDIKALNGKVVDEVPETINLQVPRGHAKTIIIALAGNKEIYCLKDGQEIGNSFEKTLVTVDDLNNTGFQKTYSVFKQVNATGYSKVTNYEISFADYIAVPEDAGTYFEETYIQDFYTD